MADYVPPFAISNRMITLIALIGEKLGRIGVLRSFDSRPQLRRNNRIRSIHSSLAIEANSLSVDEVRGVIDGRTVLGPQREIREVLNAYAAYEELGRFDPFSVQELKRLHGVMTCLTVEEAGEFRRGEEGVFDGDRCIFMAPPARLVPQLVDDLFGWMARERCTVHPLIMSSVFHYEFVFIHPFRDGNGRMARLWQTALLTQWDPVFQYLPIESRIHEFQAEYYDAIAQCHREGRSDRFIEFMLEKIDEALASVIRQAAASDGGSPYVSRLLAVMEYDIPYTAPQLLALLGLKSKDTLRRHYLNPALESALIGMTIPDKPTSRNQRYIKRS